jgi:hypothetical protein
LGKTVLWTHGPRAETRQRPDAGVSQTLDACSTRKWRLAPRRPGREPEIGVATRGQDATVNHGQAFQYFSATLGDLGQLHSVEA